MSDIRPGMSDIRAGDVWRARGPKRLPETERRRVRIISAIPRDRWLLVEGYPSGRRSRPETALFPSRFELVERDGRPVGGQT